MDPDVERGALSQVVYGLIFVRDQAVAMTPHSEADVLAFFRPLRAALAAR